MSTLAKVREVGATVMQIMGFRQTGERWMAEE
jgi:hypothetical protein